MSNLIGGVIVLTFSVIAVLVDGLESSFYVDNDLQQTVRLDPLPVNDKKEMQQEILTLLGLHHRPKPVPHVKQNSAPRFMMGLYQRIQDEQEREEAAGDGDAQDRGDNTGAPGRSPAGSTDGNTADNSDKMSLTNISLGIIPNVNDADMIMSFVNHGKDATLIG